MKDLQKNEEKPKEEGQDGDQNKVEQPAHSELHLKKTQDDLTVA